MSNYLITGARNNTPHITSMDDASFNAGVIGNGAYILDRGEKLRAEMTSSNSCRIYDGDLVVQGRHVRIETSDYIDLTINNGEPGMLRNDLIVARYEKDEETGVESVDFVVIQGTADASSPVDPEYTEGDIFGGDIVAEFPIYRIHLNGIVPSTPEMICTIVGGIADPTTLPIEKGGTGATSASGARNNLGLGSYALLNVLPCTYITTADDLGGDHFMAIALSNDITLASVTLPQYAKGVYISPGSTASGTAVLIVVGIDSSLYVAYRSGSGVWTSAKKVS